MQHLCGQYVELAVKSQKYVELLGETLLHHRKKSMIYLCLLLILLEPTRGVDVGARVEIYELINNIVENGGAVLMASSDLPEVLGMSDRILVMSNGKISGELAASEATQEKVMELAVTHLSESDK